MSEGINGGPNIRLTWAQIAWGVGVVFLLGAQWFKLDDVKQEQDSAKAEMMKVQNDITDIKLQLESIKAASR